MKIDIEESNDLAELELYEEEINDYIAGNASRLHTHCYFEISLNTNKTCFGVTQQLSIMWSLKKKEVPDLPRHRA